MINVYFALGAVARTALADGDILIYPSSDSWNDFGYQTLCEFEVVGTDVGGVFRMAFLDTEEKKVVSVFNETLNGGQSPVRSDSFRGFFSLQNEMERYRSIVSTLGPKRAKEILLALHDLVAVTAFEPQAPWLSKALESPHFSMSFVRSSDANFAFHNASTVLGGVELEDVSSAASLIALSFRLQSFTSDHSFKFTFSSQSLPPKRIAVVIGKNGVGKSRTLNRLVLSALDASAGDATLFFDDGAGALPRLSRILAVCTPGEAEATFPDEPAVPARYVYKRISANGADRQQTLPQTIVNLSRDKRQIGANWRWKIFEESVRQVLDFDELILEPRTDIKSSYYGVPLHRLWQGGEQSAVEARFMVNPSGKLQRRLGAEAVPLSSGQQSFVRLAAQLCMYVENGSLVLMDEPETHLHPNLITGLVAMLDRVLALTGSIALIATHSAYLVREVPQSQVHIIRENETDRTVEVVRPRLKTFGAEVGAISHFVFGDDIVNRLIDQLEVHLSSDSNAAHRWLESIEAELSTEAVMALRREIQSRKEGKA